MLQYLIIIGLILLAGGWILFPLLRSNSPDYALNSAENEALAQLEHQKEEAYVAIKDLEFDQNMGKISKQDFELLKKQYLLDAIGYLKEIDEWQVSASKKKKINEASIMDEIENEVSALQNTSGSKDFDLFCVQCGTKSSSLKRFCSSCGAKIVRPDSV
jgi:hypothetical protein